MFFILYEQGLRSLLEVILKDRAQRVDIGSEAHVVFKDGHDFEVERVVLIEENVEYDCCESEVGYGQLVTNYEAVGAIIKDAHLNFVEPDEEELEEVLLILLLELIDVLVVESKE